MATSIAVSPFNTKPFCSATNVTTVRPLDDHYSIEVTVPYYKSTAYSIPSKSTSSKGGIRISPAKNSSPGKY